MDNLGWCGSSQWIDIQQNEIQESFNNDIYTGAKNMDLSAETFFINNNSIIQQEINIHPSTTKVDHDHSSNGGINYGPYIANPYCGLVSDLLGCTMDHKTTSLDSLDCLISTTNSYNTTTDTSGGEDEDAGIFWKFPASGGGAESQNKEEQNHFFKNVLHDKSSTPHKLASSSKRRNTDDDDHFQPDQNGKRFISNQQNQNPRKQKKARAEPININFQQQQQQSNSTTNNSSLSCLDHQEADPEAAAQMKEMIYRAAVFRPVNLGTEVVEKPKRKNVKISSDPQTVAARQRRERISERIRVLQKLVPGGSKMDTASMLDEAASYLKFLRSQVKALENNLGHKKNININHNVDNINSPPYGMCFNTNLTFPSLPFNHMNNHSFPMQTSFPFHLP